uniref:Uncharacterized protein n=1 Tax=Arundo donax TaxID=35708 RepID=A0A0A8XV94_ARUDO
MKFDQCRNNQMEKNSYTDYLSAL